MRKLGVFNMVSLDGYFAASDGDISWHHFDAEVQAFGEENAGAGAALLFGRVTYEMMKDYWPSPQAIKEDPVTARGMNSSAKVVFSRTLDTADWENTRLFKTDLEGEVRRLKAEPGKDLVILGSGTIVSQLAQAGLIDEYQLMVNPVTLGQGKSMFAGGKDRLEFDLTGTRKFKNGNVLLTYEGKH